MLFRPRQDPKVSARQGSRRLGLRATTTRVPLKNTIRVPFRGATRVPIKGTLRIPLRCTTRVPLKGRGLGISGGFRLWR